MGAIVVVIITIIWIGTPPPQSAVTVAVDALMTGKQGPEVETFDFIDPKLPPGQDPGDRAKQPFKEAIVFMIGGGNYQEREALKAWAAKSTPPKNVVYGATDMLNGEEVVEQLAELGTKSGVA